MRSICPFADYDFWGFLTSGGYLVAVFSLALGINPFSEPTPPLLATILIIGAAYVVGHVNAALSSFLLEDRLTALWVGRPVEILTGEKQPPLAIRKLLPRFSSPLSPLARANLESKFSQPARPSAQDVFFKAYHYSRRFSDSRERLDNFRNQYGFCRNAAMAALVSIPLWCSSASLLNISAAAAMTSAAFVALMMFIRYLQFYRHFALEAVNTFIYRDAEAA